jgi:hypothetical protein
MERVSLTDPYPRGGEMPKRVLIEEFHVSVFVPRGLSEVECISVRRTLNGKRFRADLRRVIQTVVRRHPSLKKVHVTITR